MANIEARKSSISVLILFPDKGNPACEECCAFPKWVILTGLLCTYIGVKSERADGSSQSDCLSTYGKGPPRQVGAK